MKSYRDLGAIGALLDEYERALDDFYLTIAPISSHELISIVAPVQKTKIANLSKQFLVIYLELGPFI